MVFMQLLGILHLSTLAYGGPRVLRLFSLPYGSVTLFEVIIGSLGQTEKCLDDVGRDVLLEITATRHALFYIYLFIF